MGRKKKRYGTMAKFKGGKIYTKGRKDSADLKKKKCQKHGEMSAESAVASTSTSSTKADDPPRVSSPVTTSSKKLGNISAASPPTKKKGLHKRLQEVSGYRILDMKEFSAAIREAHVCNDGKYYRPRLQYYRGSVQF